MLSQKSQLMIRKLSELLLISGPRTSSSDNEASPRSPLDEQLNSPRNSKRFDPGAVGLGIVAASEGSSRVLTKPRSGLIDDLDMEMEEYTYVTCHHGPNKSQTRVYYDGYELGTMVGCGLERVTSGSCERCHMDAGKESPARSAEDWDFLGSCDCCKKKLHGRDIYIYRGEKAFCSGECRWVDMMAKDE